MAAVLHVRQAAAGTDTLRLRRVVNLGLALHLRTRRPAVPGLVRLLATRAAAAGTGLSLLLALTPEPRPCMGLTRRAEPLVLRLEFLQFLRLLRNHSLQTGNLLAHAHNRVRAAVDTGGVQEPLQPCQLLLQLAQVPRTLAAAKLLQLRTRRGKLLAVALEDPAQSVEFATGPDRFQLPFIGMGFRFPEPVFQCRDPGLRRLRTRMLPFVQAFPLLRRQGRWIDNIANRAFGIQHAAGLTDVGRCCQKKMKSGKPAIKRRKSRPSRLPRDAMASCLGSRFPIHSGQG